MLEIDPSKRISASEALKHSWILNANSDSHLQSAHEKIKSKYQGKIDRGSIHKGQGIMGFLFRGRASMQDSEDGINGEI